MVGGGGWGETARESSRVQRQRFTPGVLSSADVRCSARKKGVVAAQHGVSPVGIPAFLPPPLRADRVGVADGPGILSSNSALPSAIERSPAKTKSEAKNAFGEMKLLALRLVVASGFNPCQARPTGTARIGINFALNSALFSSGGGISHKPEFQENDGG